MIHGIMNEAINHLFINIFYPILWYTFPLMILISIQISIMISIRGRIIRENPIVKKTAYFVERKWIVFQRRAENCYARFIGIGE